MLGQSGVKRLAVYAKAVYVSDCNKIIYIIQWNLSDPTYEGTWEMCWIVQFSLVSRNTLGPSILFACHRMPEDSCVWLHKFHSIYNCKMMSFLLDCKILHISSKNFGSNYTYMLICLYNISFVVFMVEPEGKMAEKCIRSGTICHTKHLSIILSDLNSFGPLVS